MAKQEVLCSACNGKVTFTDETLTTLDLVGSTFDCNICGALMVIEKDLTTTSLTKKMADSLSLSHNIPKDPDGWQSISLA